MKQLLSTRQAAILLVAGGLLAGMQQARADAEADCRQEARDYEIVPEMVEEYVYDCVNSRGGNFTVEAEQGGDIATMEAAEEGPRQ